MRLSPGVMLGPYRLVEPAATGGPVEVWRASRPGLPRDLIVKILPRQLVDQQGHRERFIHAASAITRLYHPNILPVRDFGEQDGHAFLVSPSVAGLTLDYLLGAAWPAAEAALVLDPLASALDYAHARRVVHGEVKPLNVLISDSGQVYLDGFGVGWALEEASSGEGARALARARWPFGRPRHLAPEVAAGGRTSPAADRYGLGTIAFELLTGRPPFEIETWPLELQPRPPGLMPQPCTLSPELPSGVVALLFRALAEDPKDRPPTAAAMVRALEAVERPAPPAEAGVIQASRAPVAVAEPVPRPSEKAPEADDVPLVRRHLKRGMAGAGVAALAAGLVYLLVLQPALALLAGRGDHAAVLLESGEVLIAGGCANVPPDASAMAIVRRLRTLGLKDAGPAWLDSTLLYSAAGDRWSPAGRLSQARCEPRAMPMANGRVLVVGGSAGGAGPVQTAERYDRATNSWSAAGKLWIARREFALAMLASGQVLVVGGSGPAPDSEPLGSGERYDPAINSWSLTASLERGRRLHTATLLADGRVLVAGGLGGRAGLLAETERWDPVRNAWSASASMQQARSNHTATLLPDGRVLVVGGSGERRALPSAEWYDPAGDTWTRLAALNEARANHTATLLPSGQVLVVGGSGLNGSLATAERYDPGTNSWLPAGSLPRARMGHSATLLPDGRVLVVGGRAEADGPYLQTADIYDPAEQRWRSTADLPS